MKIRATEERDWMILKEIRLAALLETAEGFPLRLGLLAEQVVGRLLRTCAACEQHAQANARKACATEGRRDKL